MWFIRMCLFVMTLLWLSSCLHIYTGIRHSSIQLCLTNLLWPGLFYKHLHWLIWLFFFSEFSKHWTLKFWENVHTPLYVTCHMSHIRCQVSPFLDKVVELVLLSLLLSDPSWANFIPLPTTHILCYNFCTNHITLIKEV